MFKKKSKKTNFYLPSKKDVKNFETNYINDLEFSSKTLIKNNNDKNNRLIVSCLDVHDINYSLEVFTEYLLLIKKLP